MNKNIISINNVILARFNEEINDTVNKLNELTALINTGNLLPEIMNRIIDEINELNNNLSINCEKDLYLSQTIKLINNYVTILKTPICKNERVVLDQKLVITNEFIDIVKFTIVGKKWLNVQLPNIKNINPHLECCLTCGNTDVNDFESDKVCGKTCLKCSTHVTMLEVGHTHLDYTRVNIIGKFVYNRVLHFQDCIKQFQGKQNCKIPDSLYKELDNKFKTYRLILDSENCYVRYSKITKQHILMFLKELKYVKHYENINFIYYTLTNKRTDDISHLEHKLIEDFKELVILYDNLHSKDQEEELDRKNFMNVQYLLFQLLRRHSYPCKIEDFSILKTTDRKLFHDKICSNLFKKLGWTFTPVF
jgi:hypothetical protein